MNILVVGRQPEVLERAERELDLPDVTMYGTTTLPGVERIVQDRRIEHVFMGPGLDLELRLSMVRCIFEAGDGTCVHMKDFSRGPEGALDFIRGIVDGLNRTYHRTAATPTG